MILFFVIWGVLGYLVDKHCRGKAGLADHHHAAGHGASAAAVSGAATATAEAGEAERKAAEERAAAAAAEADRKAAEDRAAAEAAEAERKAAEERAAAEAAEAERKAAEERAAAEAAEAERKAAEERAAAEAAEAERKAAEAERQAEIERATAAGEADYDGDGVVEGSFEGTRPEALEGPRGGNADDLKRIKGIGPKLEKLCNTLGFWHFDQIAKWTADEVAWVDSNLEGFKGRVTRDEWVAQAEDPRRAAARPNFRSAWMTATCRPANRASQ